MIYLMIEDVENDEKVNVLWLFIRIIVIYSKAV